MQKSNFDTSVPCADTSMGRAWQTNYNAANSIHITMTWPCLERGLLGFIVAVLGLLPVDNVPPLLKVGGLVVPVLEVPRVLPNVTTDDRVVRQKRVLVLGRYDIKVARLAKTEPALTRALNRS